jgi:hypothetical protein
MAAKTAAKPKAPARKRGRPPKGKPVDTPETRDEILRRVADGEPLVRICADDHMPDVVSVHNWRRKDSEFAEAFERARQDSADKLADEIISLADESMAATDKTQAQAYRLRVDARKWAAAKLKPQSYGDKQQVELSGEVAIRQLDDKELDNRLVALMAALDASLHR